MGTPHVRLGVLLAWLRILAGRRGTASAQWAGAGFTYQVVVTRGTTGGVVVIDYDPTVVDREGLAARVREALTTQP